jgi:hypothetical protein
MTKARAKATDRRLEWVSYRWTWELLRVSSRNGRQISASFSVQGPDLRSPTIIEGSSSKHNANFTDADFTPEAIEKLK